MQLSSLQNKKGFTLVETLVSLAIFTSAVVGMIVITSQGINDTVYAKNKLVATALSQEGIEIVRNIRDSSLLANSADGWNDFLTTVDSCMSSMCDIDPLYEDVASVNIIQCPTQGDCRLRRDTTLGDPAYYTNQGSGDETSFSRTIKINGIDLNSVEIISTVSWIQGSGAEKEVVSKEYLTNWFNNTVTP